MSDQPNTPAAPEPAAPASPPAPDMGQPAEPQSPQPQAPTATNPATPPASQYTPQQIEEWKRGYEHNKGSQQLVAPLIAAGIKSPDDLSGLLEFRQVAQERGADIGSVTSLLRGNQTPAKQEPEPITVESIRGVVSGEITQHAARVEDQAAEVAMNNALSTARGEIATKTGFGTDSPVLTAFVDKLVNEAMQESRYPVGHPLRDQVLKPLDSTTVASIKERAIQELITARGQSAVAQATADLNSTPQQPSGNGLESAGEPPKPRVNFGGQNTADEIAWVEQIQRKNRGAPDPAAARV